MKILYIIHDNRKGGAAVSFLDMIRGVAEKHEVFVLTPHNKGYIPDELDKMGIWHKNAHYFWWEIAKIGSPFTDSVRFLLYKMLNAYNRIEAARLSRMINRMGIDIIHSNSSVINIGALISEKTGLLHVWHLRELALPEYPIYPARKKDTLGSVLNTGNNTYIAISEYAAKFYGSFIDNAVCVPVGGEHSLDSEDLSFDEAKRGKHFIFPVYNGISSSYDHEKKPEEYGLDEISFLISGNYSEDKGQTDVAKAAAGLLAQGIMNFKVYMAGRGDFEGVKKVISDYGPALSDHIIFCGLVDDMLSLRKKCDVEIVASMTEAFGRVTVEAMRASNPVIGSATGGTAELIRDGETGFLFAYKDVDALTNHMKKYIENHSLAFEMGHKAYEWSVGRFTSKECAERVLEIYENITKMA